MYIDAHNHIEEYGDKLPAALEMMAKDGIRTLACAMDIDSYLYARETARSCPFILPAFGVHPWRAAEQDPDLSIMDDYIKEAPVLGELGLDFFWVEDKKSYPAQVRVLEYFLRKAKEQDKPASLHTKGAEREVLELLKKYQVRPPMIHWYSGPRDIFRQLLDYGCFFTVGVDLGYSSLTRELVTELPLERLLTETDGPAALEWTNGEYGWPDRVKYLVEEIARIKNIPIAEMRDIISGNFHKAIAAPERK